MSTIMSGRTLSDEHRQNISASKLGKKLPPRTEEHSQHLSEALSGKPKSESHKQHISEAMVGKESWNKGIPCDESTKEKIREANTGRKHTDEELTKMRESHLGVRRPPRDAKWCENIRKSKIGKLASDETKEKMRIAHSGENAYWLGKNLPESAKEKLRQYTGELKKGVWKGGISFEPYCPKFTKVFKERVRAYFNYTCFECGKTQADNGKRLHVHHVNFDKSACCSDTKPLFVPLCDNCHPKTNFNRDYWEDHFVEKLYSQDPDGKCFFTQEEYHEYLKSQ